MTNEPLQEIHAAIRSLQRLSNAFLERRRQLAQSVGLTEHQWGVLEEISTEHFMPSMFARKRDSSPAAVSKTLRQLVDKGLIEVTLNKSDARQRHYQLSARGRRVMAKLRHARSRAIEDIWQKLDIERVREFTRFGDELSQALLRHGRNTRETEDPHDSNTLPESL